MKVFAALHNPMIYESSAHTMSLHLTKAGAYRAIRRHKIEVWEEEVSHRRSMLRKWRSGLERYRDPFSFMWWGITEMEVQE